MISKGHCLNKILAEFFCDGSPMNAPMPVFCQIDSSDKAFSCFSCVFMGSVFMGNRSGLLKAVGQDANTTNLADELPPHMRERWNRWPMLVSGLPDCVLQFIVYFNLVYFMKFCFK